MQAKMKKERRRNWREIDRDRWGCDVATPVPKHYKFHGLEGQVLKCCKATGLGTLPLGRGVRKPDRTKYTYIHVSCKSCMISNHVQVSSVYLSLQIPSHFDEKCSAVRRQVWSCMMDKSWCMMMPDVLRHCALLCKWQWAPEFKDRPRPSNLASPVSEWTRSVWQEPLEVFYVGPMENVTFETFSG